MDTTVESTVGRKVLENLQRMNAERQAAKAARRDVIAELSKGWPGGRRPTAKQIRECWIALAPDISPPSERSIYEHLAAIRGDRPVQQGSANTSAKQDEARPRPREIDYELSQAYRQFSGPTVKGPRDK
jgi:hypothetical protein